MEWINKTTSNMVRFELTENDEILAIVQKVDNTYLVKNLANKTEFLTRANGNKVDILEKELQEILQMTEKQLYVDWRTQSRKLSRLAGELVKKEMSQEISQEMVVLNYKLGQEVWIVDCDLDTRNYKIHNAIFKGVCKEDGMLFYVYESMDKKDTFLLNSGANNVYDSLELATVMCEMKNEKLR